MRFNSTDFFDTSKSRYGKQLIFDKQLNTRNTIDLLLNQTNNMFIYENLPDTIPQRILEGMLQELGSVLICKHKGELYVYEAIPTGRPNQYYEHEQYIVHNVAQSINGVIVTLDKSATLIRNDIYTQGLIPIMLKYATFKTESDITMTINLILSRLTNAITVGDSDDAIAVNQMYKDLEEGTLKVMELDDLLSELNVHEIGQKNVDFRNIIEVERYLKAEVFNLLGMPLNDNMKSQYISDSETEQQQSGAMYFTLTMLEERRKGIEKCNKLWGTNIDVKLNPEWFGFIEEIKEYQEENEPEKPELTDNMNGGHEDE